jgi:hypothetical protein
VPRNILPWVLLATAVVVAVAVLRNPAPKETAPVASSAPSTSASVSPAAPSVRTFNDPPLSDLERREIGLHIGHEECELGAKRINELEGREPTDFHGVHFIGVCLQHGNVAWYKCIVASPTRQDAAACNRRLLNSANAP